MRKLLFFLLAFTLLPSCIEIREYLSVNTNGSGVFRLEVDMGKMGAMLNTSGQQFDLSIIDSIRNKPLRARAMLQTLKGITDVVSVKDDKKGLYAVGFAFANSKALNRALYALFNIPQKGMMPPLISTGRHKVNHIDPAPVLKKYALRSQSFKSAGFIYQLLKVKTQVRLPAPARKISNIYALTERGDSTVNMSYTVYQLMNEQRDYGLKVRF